MATLEKVIQMKQQGIPESQIIQSLRDEGVTPREINDAISQSKIKTMIDLEKGMQQNSTTSAMFSSNTNIPDLGRIEQNNNVMQPSMMGPSETETMPPKPSEALNEYNPSQTYNQNFQQTQSYQPQSDFPQPYTEQPNQISPYQDEINTYNQQNYPEYQPNPEYPEYSPDYSQGSTDIETINEIAEQIFEEKTNDIKKKISALDLSKESITEDIVQVKQKIIQLEKNFEELQMAILRKIGDYGQNIENISKEMKATQISFSKVLDPLTENIKELKRITQSNFDSKNQKQQSN